MVKYQGAFFKKLKETLYYRKDPPHPLDPLLEKWLPVALTRMLLYDFDRVSQNKSEGQPIREPVEILYSDRAYFQIRA